MMNENTKKLIEVIEARREEIIELSKSCYAGTMNGSYFQGWRVGVIADIDGNIYDYQWTQGTTDTAIYEGKAVRVVEYVTGNDIPEYEICDADLGERTEEFIKFLIENEYLDKEDMENWRYELNWRNINEFDSELASELDKNYIEWDVNENYAEEADRQIDETLEDLKQQLEYEEE